jgi:hypothetical protein
VAVILPLSAQAFTKNRYSDNQKGRRPLNIQVLSTVLFLSLATTAAAENRIYQTDKYGNIEYNKPSYTVQENGRIVETDKFGNKQYHKDQQQIQGNKIYQTDKFGNIQYHKPSLTTEKH